MAESPASRTLPLAVWAPTATTLRAVLPAGKDDGPDAWVSLTRDDAGVWHGELPADTDYLFAVDDQAPRPDPRSPRQPHGIHGPSRTFDAGAFAWTDAGWRGRDVLGGVLYEIHVGTFTPEGTLDAAIGRLDYLATLGIDTVELMPIVPFPGDRGWGYDGVSLYA
ncbi:MAG: malto-oligosyltrehalose trehalohydrolase, partial [Propioniciclava sp.]